MEHQDYLSLIAELAVAFAGFTGIVGVFRYRSGKWQAFELANFSTMLRASLSALFISLLPYVIFQLTNNENLSWQIAAGAVAAIMATNLYAFGVKGRLMFSHTTHRLLFPPGVIICLANILGAISLLSANLTVLVAVTWQLFVAAHNFVLLISEPDMNPESSEKKATKNSD